MAEQTLHAQLSVRPVARGALRHVEWSEKNESGIGMQGLERAALAALLQECADAYAVHTFPEASA